MVRCPACGAPVPEGYRWCGSCGARVAAAEPTPATGPPPAERVSPTEGRTTPEHAGHALVPVRPAASRRLRLIAGVALAVVVVLVAVQTVVRPPRDLDAVGRGGASFDGTYDTDPGPLTGDRRWRRDRPTTTATPAVGRATVADGVAYVPAGPVLTAVDVADGRVLWRAELPSAVSGPPAVVDGPVVVVGGDGWIRGLGASDGTIRWTLPLSGAGPVTVAATPFGGLVAATGDGQVMPVTAGGVIGGWRLGPRALAGDGADRVDGPIHVTVPPVVWSGLVLVTVSPGDGGAGRVVSLEAGTGRVRWRSPVPVRPDRAVVPLGSVLLAATSEGVAGIDVQQGWARWMRTLPDATDAPGVVVGAIASDRPVALTSSLVVALTADVGDVIATADAGGGDLAVVGSRVITSGPGRVLTARRPDSLAPAWTTGTNIPGPATLTPTDDGVLVGGTDGSLALVDVAAGGAVRWWKQIVGLDDCPLVGGGDVVYLALAEHLYAFDAAAGTLDWSYTAPAPLAGGIAAAHGRVAVPDRRGLVHVLDARRGTQVATGVGGDANLGAVVVADDHTIVVGGALGFPLQGGKDGYLRALDLADGSPRWLTYLTDGLAAPPSAAGGLVVALTRRGTVEALDVATGEMRWSTLIGTTTTGPAAIGVTSGAGQDAATVAGVVALGGDDGAVRVLDLATGGQLWHLRPGLPLRRQPAVADGLVVVRLDTHTLAAFAARTGEQRWQAHLDDVLTAPVSVAGSRVFAGTSTGVQILDLATGHMRGQITREEPVTAAPVITHAGIVVCEASGAIEALR